jgi:hypothetical protein
LKEEAGEVVTAVGAWVYCFFAPRSEDTDAGRKEREKVEEVIRSVREVVNRHGGEEGVAIAVAVDWKGRKNEGLKMDAEAWEDSCMELGFEFVEYAAEGKNEFGEKVGFERLKEALEANEWDDGAGDEDGLLGLDDGELDDDLEESGFGREEAQMTAELFGMKAALYGGDDADEEDDFETRQADQVDDLDRLMSKLLAVKEQSADLPEAERKRMAAKAVRDLMKSDGSI